MRLEGSIAGGRKHAPHTMQKVAMFGERSPQSGQRIIVTNSVLCAP
jgi:hypothetical protein